MSRKVTKASENVYCKARLTASESEPMFLTRSGASMLIPGITEDSIKKYELGITIPPCDAVALMADAYNAPELTHWYCANQCPLGQDHREIECTSAERVILRVKNSTDGLFTALDTFSKVMDDGVVDITELGKIDSVRDSLLEVKRRLDEAIASCDKIIKRGGT